MAEATVGLLRVVLASNSTQFDASMDKSGAKVDAFSQAGKRAGASLARMVNDFNGTKVTAEATRMATAIEKVGGVSKLTDGDLARVNRTLDAAIAKYKILGQDVPPQITKLKTEVSALDTASGTAATGGLGKFSGALGMVSKILPALGIASAVTSIIRLGTAALESADKHVTFADKLGVSTETTQRWAYVAGQTGTTMEAFGDSAFKLGVNVSNGTTQARKAVSDLGLAYVELKNLKPEQQFDVVMKAMEGVESATERNRIGQALFGRQFSEIAAAVSAGYTQMKDEATIAGDAQVRAAERAGDAWQKMKDKVAAAALSIAGGLSEAAFDTAAAMGLLATGTDKYTEAQRHQIAVLQGQGGEGLAALLDSFNGARSKDIALTGAATDANTDYVAKLKELRAEVAGLTEPQKSQIDAAIKMEGITDELADTLGVSVEALRLYQSGVKGSAKELREYESDAKKAAKAAQDFADSARNIQASNRTPFGNVFTVPRGVEDSSTTIGEIRESMDAMASISFNRTWPPFVSGARDAGQEMQGVSARLRETAELGRRMGDIVGSFYDRLTGNLSHLIFGLGHDMDGALQRTANQSTLVYRQILADGSSTPEQITSAFETMQRDIDAANYTFKERFKQVWIDIKGAVFNVFDEILGEFVNRVVRGMIGAMAGQQGAMGAAFSGMFGRGAGSAAGVAAGGGSGGGGAAGTSAAAGVSGAAVAGGIGSAAAGYFAGRAAQNWLGAGWRAGGVGALGGAAMGAAIGSIVPGLGTAVGAVIGGVVGFAAGFIGTSKEVKAARTEVASFQDQLRSTLTDTQKQEAGGERWKETVIAVTAAYEATGRTAAEAAAITEQLWDTENPERAAAAMREISGVMLEYNKILQTIENTKAAVGIFDEIMAAGAEGIPAHFQPAIDKLIELGLLTDEQAAKLRGLNKVDTKGMEAAMDVLKGRIESLGPAFRQAKMDETAMVYVNAIQTLIDGGADWGGVMMDAREEIGKLVADSLQFKTTIPANMKPWIEDLFASGNLIDENGDKITDISNIKYGEAQKTQAEIAKAGWDAILAKIDQLIEKIANPLNDAIDNATRDRTINVGINVDDPDRVLDREDRERNRASFSSGTIGRYGKYFNQFSTGTPALLHGMEAVLRPQDAVPFSLDTLSSLMPSFAGGAVNGAAPVNTTNFVMVAIPMESAGDVFAITNAVVRALPQSIQMNQADLRVGIERVIEDYDRTYRRGNP